MNAKQIFRVLIIVLAALALTALVAMAQDEPVPVKEAPAVIEKGESASPAANLTETEWNDGFNNANPIAIGDVISGRIKTGTDLDYFKVEVPENTNVLIDIDAQAVGSPLDARICLYDTRKSERGCNDDADGADSLLFRLLHDRDWLDGGTYYIRVQDVNYPNGGGMAYTYNLAVYEPLLISATLDGTVAGLPFRKSDVLAHYDFADGTEKWMLFFDASDVGITKNVVGLAGTSICCGDISLVLQATQRIPVGESITTATPFDVLTFDPGPDGHFGPSTVGQFTGVDPGAGYGLSGAGEKIDALALRWDISTVGNATFFSGEKVADEDITNQAWGTLSFDGSIVPGLAAEDVFAADAGWGGYYLTILGSGVVDGLQLTQKDIFTVSSHTMRVTGLYWHGPDHGFDYNIDAIETDSCYWGG